MEKEKKMKLLICLAVVLLIITTSVICFSIDGDNSTEGNLLTSTTQTTLPSVQITETTTPEYYSHLNRHQHHQNDHPDHQYTKPSTESSESVENENDNNQPHRIENEPVQSINTIDEEENDSEEEVTNGNGNENLDYDNVVKEEELWPAKTNAPPLIRTNSTGLQKDFEDFLQLIPYGEVKNISVKYYRKDLEIRSIVNYMKGREFIHIRNNIFGLREVQDFANYLKDCGVNFVQLVNFVKRLIGDFDHYDLTIPHYNRKITFKKKLFFSLYLFFCLNCENVHIRSSSSK